MKNKKIKKIKVLIIDNSLEFINEEFNQISMWEGIIWHKTVVHTPQQNGLAKKMHKINLERK